MKRKNRNNPTKKKGNYLRDACIGASGFAIGSLIGNIIFRSIFFSSFFGLFINIIDKQQVLQRLFVAVVLFLLGIALGGAVIGAFGGWFISKFNLIKENKSYIGKSAIALSSTQALLIIPIILLAAIIARYHNFELSVKSFVIFFSFYGAVFGLIAGLLLGLMVRGWRYFWMVVIPTLIGYGFGGMVFGIGLWGLWSFSQKQSISSNLSVIAILILMMVFNALGGAGISASLLWKKKGVSKQTRFGNWYKKYKKYIWLLIVALIIWWVVSFSSQIIDFLMVRPASLSTQLSVSSSSVAWTQPAEARKDIGYKIRNEIANIGLNNISDEDSSGVCKENQVVIVNGDEEVKIEKAQCIGQVTYISDSQEVNHIVWLSNDLGESLAKDSGNYYVMESILKSDGIWSEPAIVTQVDQEVKLAVFTDGPDLVIGWIDNTSEEEKVLEVKQGIYECDPNTFDGLGKVVIDEVSEGKYWKDNNLLYCQNVYDGYVYMPNPESEYSGDNKTINGGFDTVSDWVDDAKYEVLFATMEWQETINNDSPGAVFAKEVNDLYEKVKENPEEYPRGLTIRILLGNYPVTADFTFGSQVWNVIKDLKEAGLPELINDELGWKVEIANFDGTWPHSHTKFVVVDGRKMMASGFNYGYLHFSKKHPSGKGGDLEDIGIAISGPVAQMGLSVFDDIWNDANQMECIDFVPEIFSLWKRKCTSRKAVVSHTPEVLKIYIPENAEAKAYSLYRNEVFKEADQVIYNLMNAANKTIDIYQVNFSMELICDLSILMPDICTFDNHLPFMDSILKAVDNGAKIRVITESSNMNGIENTIGIKFLREELEEKGLSDQVEIKFINGRMHDKVVLIDDELLVVGSHNFHYSAWGERGLVEYSLGIEDKDAIEDFKKLFNYHWDRSEIVEGPGQLKLAQ